MAVYDIMMLFFTYSFLGWLGETIYVTVKRGHFANRGFTFGPFCFLYGFAGVVISVGFADAESTAFIFVGSMITATAMQLGAAKLLERAERKKWWDYSDKKWNYDGYICLGYSVLWGVLGIIAVRVGNGLFYKLYSLLPLIAEKIIVWALVVFSALDFIHSLPETKRFEGKLAKMRSGSRVRRAGEKIRRTAVKRIEKAYPTIAEGSEIRARARLTLSDVVWMFAISSFLGDVAETIFCRAVDGVWMSRSSLVWGPFSVVWGLGLVLGSMLLGRMRKQSDGRLFVAGVLLGGVYEYICSVFTEIVFGTVFWDYSEMPYNVGGRINLLYCFFWGIAVVIWIKLLYPRFLAFVRGVIKKAGGALTAALAIFLTLDVVVSCAALVRYDARSRGIEAENVIEQVIDERFADERMEKIYPNALSVNGENV